MDSLIENLRKLIADFQLYIDAQKPMPTTSQKLLTFCEAIKTHEGWYPGSRSYRNHNPGNARYSSVGYLDIYKPVRKDKDGFAIFRDDATGELYLHNLVKSKIKRSPESTILDFFKVYAPAADHNDPTRYAQYVAKQCGVDTSFKIKNLL